MIARQTRLESKGCRVSFNTSNPNRVPHRGRWHQYPGLYNKSIFEQRSLRSIVSLTAGKLIVLNLRTQLEMVANQDGMFEREQQRGRYLASNTFLASSQGIILYRNVGRFADGEYFDQFVTVSNTVTLVCFGRGKDLIW